MTTATVKANRSATTRSPATHSRNGTADEPEGRFARWVGLGSIHEREMATDNAIAFMSGAIMRSSQTGRNCAGSGLESQCLMPRDAGFVDDRSPRRLVW